MKERIMTLLLIGLFLLSSVMAIPMAMGDSTRPELMNEPGLLTVAEGNAAILLALTVVVAGAFAWIIVSLLDKPPPMNLSFLMARVRTDAIHAIENVAVHRIVVVLRGQSIYKGNANADVIHPTACSNHYDKRIAYTHNISGTIHKPTWFPSLAR